MGGANAGIGAALPTMLLFLGAALPTLTSTALPTLTSAYTTHPDQCCPTHPDQCMPVHLPIVHRAAKPIPSHPIPASPLRALPHLCRLVPLTLPHAAQHSMRNY